MRGWQYAVLLALQVGCGGSSGFAVDIKAVFSGAVSDSTLATITALDLQASGDETQAQTIPLENEATRTESFVFTPFASSRALEISVRALDAQQNVVAEGQSGPLTLNPGKTTSTTIDLDPPTNTIDLGVTDMTVIDFTAAD